MDNLLTPIEPPEVSGNLLVPVRSPEVSGNLVDEYRDILSPPTSSNEEVKV